MLELLKTMLGDIATQIAEENNLTLAITGVQRFGKLETPSMNSRLDMFYTMLPIYLNWSVSGTPFMFSGCRWY